MSARPTFSRTTGIVLVGTHPWTNSAFDKLAPRPLLPIAHRPLISYALFWMRDGGLRDVAVCANRETQVLESRLHRDVPPGIAVSYHEDAMPRGAAGAIRDAAHASDAEVFVIADGTAIPTVDLPDLLRAHAASQAAVTVVVHSETGRNGAALMQVPSGIYVFNRSALDVVPLTGFYDIKENLIPQLHRLGVQVSAYEIASASPRVLDASSYLAVNEWMVEHLVAAKNPIDGYSRVGTCLFHHDALVSQDAIFVGPVLVGPGARVMSGAVVVGPTSIGRDAIVGPGVLVSRSAIWRRSVLRDGAIADRCIVGDDAVIEAAAQAYRQIKTAATRRDPRAAVMPAPDDAEAPSFELFRRMSRTLLGATWSRSTAQ